MQLQIRICKNDKLIAIGGGITQDIVAFISSISSNLPSASKLIIAFFEKYLLKVNYKNYSGIFKMVTLVSNRMRSYLLQHLH